MKKTSDFSIITPFKLNLEQMNYSYTKTSSVVKYPFSGEGFLKSVINLEVYPKIELTDDEMVYLHTRLTVWKFGCKYAYKSLFDNNYPVRGQQYVKQMARPIGNVLIKTYILCEALYGRYSSIGSTCIPYVNPGHWLQQIIIQYILRICQSAISRVEQPRQQRELIRHLKKTYQHMIGYGDYDSYDFHQGLNLESPEGLMYSLAYDLAEKRNSNQFRAEVYKPYLKSVKAYYKHVKENYTGVIREGDFLYIYVGRGDKRRIWGICF